VNPKKDLFCIKYIVRLCKYGKRSVLVMASDNLLPKNIRQIGDIQGRQKICFEDYVMTYIRKMANRGEKSFLGVFLGEKKSTQDADYVFVRGILEIPDPAQIRQETIPDGPASEKKPEPASPAQDTSKEAQDEAGRPKKNLWQAFQKRYGVPEELPDPVGVKETEAAASPDPWKRLLIEKEQSFPGCEILGCCAIGTCPTGRMEELSSHFPEAGRILYHLQEQEERLYWLEGERYEGIRGYFVFYEPNQRMQEVLAETFGEKSVEQEGQPDKAIRSFREKVRSKAEERSHSFLKLASSFFVVGVLIVGVIVVNRVQDLQLTANRREAAQGESAAAETGAMAADTAASDDMADPDDAAEATGTADTSDTSEAVSDASETLSDEILAGSDSFWAEEEEDSSTGSADQSVGTAATAADADAGAESGSDVAMAGSEVVTAETDTASASEASAVDVEDTSEGIAAGLNTDSSSDTDTAVAVSSVSRQLQASYVIREGDTLAAICAKYYGSLDRLEELCEANGIEDADLILPGQKIVLP